jgi:hypothetical protein
MRHKLPGFMLLVSFFLFTPAVTEESEPLRDEDIVRLFVSGASAASVIETINSQPVDFDLSAEMLEELSLAGLPQLVIDTMLERQNAQHGVPGIETGEAVAPSTLPPLEPGLTVRFESAKDERIVLTLPAYIPRTYFDLWNLSGPDDVAQDIAIFLACSNPLHVPDHWRSKSPLGRDFNSVPRHRMLAFINGATLLEPGKTKQLTGKLAAGAGGEPLGKLTLEIPSSVSALLEPGESHDLLLGIAVQAASRLFVLQSDSWENVRSQAGLQLHAEIKQPKRSPYAGSQVLFKKPAEQTEQN